MRNSLLKVSLVLGSLGMLPTPSFAESPYLCAINEVYECVAVTGCSRISLEEANLSGIMLIDVDKKQISEAPLGQDATTEDVEGVSVTDEAILLHGVGKRGRSWNAAISPKTGKLSAGVSTPDSSLALLGTCTAKS